MACNDPDFSILFLLHQVSCTYNIAIAVQLEGGVVHALILVTLVLPWEACFYGFARPPCLW